MYIANVINNEADCSCFRPKAIGFRLISNSKNPANQKNKKKKTKKRKKKQNIQNFN